jgi:hypothetical protein
MSLFIEQNWMVFLVLTIIMGGGAALMAGKSLATGWKPLLFVGLYMIPFTLGMRFLNFALFGAQLTSVQYFITHGLIFCAAAYLGYRMKRVAQMTNQYPWLYEKTGPLTWRSKA